MFKKLALSHSDLAHLFSLFGCSFRQNLDLPSHCNNSLTSYEIQLLTQVVSVIVQLKTRSMIGNQRMKRFEMISLPNVACNHCKFICHVGSVIRLYAIPSLTQKIIPALNTSNQALRISGNG